MKASEMTNEELEKALMSRVPLDSNNYDDIREASARLRKLKIAEDALEEITTGSFAHKDGDKPIVQVIIDIASKALFEIREKGANNGK